ncbi:hypothetical protein NDU88_001051 [Pleurodeles waltl]|uniref:Uncharacterized protein n=1 Tax=Pleurodeles waltl TaxID=8319 RepID=A0AAV7Q8Y0_PLEWA|nr:hypothetical protein NDU88_001051 [Pleurodeles waltl]
MQEWAGVLYHAYGILRLARIGGIEDNDNGLQEEGESWEATASGGETLTPGAAASVTGEAPSEKPKLSSEERRRERKPDAQETSTFRHVPGGAWLHKSTPVKPSPTNNAR